VGINTAVYVRDKALEVIRALADGGTIRIYSGSQPSTVNGKAKGLLLAELIIGEFSSPEGGKMRADVSPDPAAKTTGRATWYRVLQDDGTALWDGDITIKGGGGSLEFDNVDIQAGAEVSIKSLTYWLPA